MEMMVINSENFEEVLECFDDALEDWIPALRNNETYAGHELGATMRQEIPRYFRNLDFMVNEKYHIKGSAGAGNWASVPWVGIFNRDITNGASKGYYIVYLFCEDMRGIYLSLNFGATYFKDQYKRNAKSKLTQAAAIFRDILKEEYDEINYYEEIDLGTNNLGRDTLAPEYEAGDIFSIFYSKEDLRNIPEEKFLEDLKWFLELYDYLYEKRGTTIFYEEEPTEEEIETIEGGPKIAEEKTFYQELKEQGLYYDKKTIENYLLSLKVKPFVILTGPSGTGKTKIALKFADYINKEDDGESYINVKTEYSKIEKDEYLSLGKGTASKVLDLGKYEGTIDFSFDDKRSNEPIHIDLRADCFDEKVIEHLKKMNEEELKNVEIKILKKDLDDTFVNENIDKKEVISFTRNVGKNPQWNIPIEDLNKIIPVKQEWNWKAIIDGIPTTIKFWVHGITVNLAKSKNNQLKEYINQKEKDDELEIKVFIDTYKLNKNERNVNVEINEKITLSENSDNYKIVPIGANWTENRNIVGFFNVLTETYQTTPSLEVLLESQSKDYPYFLILDEMNLSHVERYFSDFLSAMESGKPIPLHNAGINAESPIGNIPKEVEISENLFIVGTVNVDETTYMFSPKVLDRANTIEVEAFKDITIEKYLNNEAYKDEDFKGDESYLINPMSDSDLKDKKIEDLSDELKAIANGNDVWKSLTNDLTKINECLKPAGFEFGFRVVNEIIKFMVVSKNYEHNNINEKDGWENWHRYFDAQIKQKILPKLHGSHQILDKPLKDLLKICLIDDSDIIPKIEEINEDSAKYPESAKKLVQMINTLDNQMYVSFIN